jgi:hypothetical protein
LCLPGFQAGERVGWHSFELNATRGRGAGTPAWIAPG